MSVAISANVAMVTVVFSLNTTKVIMKQSAKHMIMVLRKPMAFTIQPEKKLPTIPPPASIIMVAPRCCCTSADVEILCTHVGAHEKIAHRPINMVPNTTEPINKFFLQAGAKSCLLMLSFLCTDSLLIFHFSDSGKVKKANTARPSGASPIQNAARQSSVKLLIIASPSVVDKLFEEHNLILADLEKSIKKLINLQAEPLYSQEQFDMVLL